MVHELIGITNQRVLLHAPNIDPEFKVSLLFLNSILALGWNVETVVFVCLQEIVLSGNHDEFFSTNMHTNFGDLCIRAKELVDDFQGKHKSQQNIQSIGVYADTCLSTSAKQQLILFNFFLKILCGSGHATLH
jgi:hypothetical protein